MIKITLAFLLLLQGVAQAGGVNDKKPTSPQKTETKTEDKRDLSQKDLAALQEKLKGHKFLSLTFEQVMFKKMRKRYHKSQGEAFFRKPDHFRWEFQSPQKEQWLFNGSHLFHYFPEKKYAHRYQSGASKGKSLTELVDVVLNFESLLKRYNVSGAYQKANEAYLSLIPKSKNDIISADLVLDTSINAIKQVKLSFRGGNHTTFHFSKPVFKTLAAQTFVLPKTVKVSDAL